jgi:hypothetical protein
VVLAIAVFDMDGRILVSAQGTLPTKKITDVWIEQVRMVDIPLEITPDGF